MKSTVKFISTKMLLQRLMIGEEEVFFVSLVGNLVLLLSEQSGFQNSCISSVSHKDT